MLRRPLHVGRARGHADPPEPAARRRAWPARATSPCSPPDYDAALRALTDAGYELRAGSNAWNAPRTFVRDPAGHLVEVMSGPPHPPGPGDVARRGVARDRGAGGAGGAAGRGVRCHFRTRRCGVRGKRGGGRALHGRRRGDRRTLGRRGRVPGGFGVPARCGRGAHAGAQHRPARPLRRVRAHGRGPARAARGRGHAGDRRGRGVGRAAAGGVRR